MGKKLSLIDFNEIFDEDKVIKNHKPVENREFSDDGIYSEKIFGSYDDEIPIDTLGWINLEPIYIINPLLYNIIKRCIPNLNKIISYEKTIDEDGNIIKDDEENEDFNMGMIEFKKNFKDLLDKYYNKKYDKEYNFIISNIDKVFINKIPVFSHKLRPATLLPKDTLVFNEINNYYNFIIQFINEINDKTLKDENDIDILNLPLVTSIQYYANTIFVKIINDYLKGKKGFLRKNILGSRINFSARNVITPLTGYEIDEISIPYLTFAELYKFQLINLISTVKGINYNKALKFWNRSILKFDLEMYKYMNELIKKTKGGCTILLNRNPTISIGSILFLKIAVVKKDFNDLTLSLSNNILSPFGGDYDGDVLNLVPVFDNKLKKYFSLLSPQNLLANRNNGKFNSDYFLMKEQQLGIYSLNNK